MKTRSPCKTVIAVGLPVLFAWFMLSSVTPAMAAGRKVVQLEGVGYHVNASLRDNLKRFIGQKVSCSLDSGHTVAGKIKEVGEHFVHLEKLEGKEFFDALVRIDSIRAIDTRFRVYE